MTDWQKQRSERSRCARGKVVSPERAKALAEAVIRPGDRVCLEGGNQKKAGFRASLRPQITLNATPLNTGGRQCL